jgi:peptidoglycan/xylan/chitin deacetylase (PgdA/CDA1 family)
VSLSAALDHADRATPLPERPIVLTFDDGTADAIRVVLPALRERGMVATFFVVSSWIGVDEAHRSQQPARSGESSRPVLIWPEVRALHEAGMEIGSHSRTHSRLPDVEEKVLLDELVGSKREIEAGLGAPVDLFAYPYNSVRARIEGAVLSAGYRAAVAGQDHGGRNVVALYRIGVYRETSPQELVGYALAGAR